MVLAKVDMCSIGVDVLAYELADQRVMHVILNTILLLVRVSVVVKVCWLEMPNLV